MVDLVSNLFVLVSGLLVFTMTISVGFLGIGELGANFANGLLKTMLITGSALFFMAFIGFNAGVAPTLGNLAVSAARAILSGNQ